MLIKEALNRNVEVTVLDAGDNFIELKKNGITEYVKQATRTSKDSYITALIMENKDVTKQILAKNGINVPAGGKYLFPDAAKAQFMLYRERNIVVKPNSTNFGTGVAVLKNPF